MNQFQESASGRQNVVPSIVVSPQPYKVEDTHIKNNQRPQPPKTAFMYFCDNANDRSKNHEKGVSFRDIISVVFE